MKNPDLHSHTHCSDGTLSPTELVHRAAKAGVDMLAITDHDTTQGLKEAELAARDLSLRLVAGVEVSVTWDGRTLHVVGLNIDAGHIDLHHGLADIRARRDQRAVAMGEKLEKKGIQNALAGARELADGAIVSRTHFARHLVNQGHARDMQHAFRRYLADGKSGFVKTEWTSLELAVQWIKSAGGQSVIAHPGRYKMGNNRLRKLFGEFRELGGDAIEVISGSQPPDDIPRFARLAEEFGLRASAGSDYHGPEQRWLELGRLPELPASCRPVWEFW